MLSMSRSLRRGAAIAEMAILLSILSFLFVVCIDFARVFYFSLTLKNCARNGAYYASDSFGADFMTFIDSQLIAQAGARRTAS